MAKIEMLAPIVLKWEGKYVNDPDDAGGPTNMGITLKTWRAVGYDKDGDGDIDEQDIKDLGPDDFKAVLRQYWNRWRADEINNQAIANILVDWVWASGAWGVKIPQRLLGLDPDGIVGPKTIAAVNAAPAAELFAKLHAARTAFFDGLVARDPSQRKFLNGWKNRLADFVSS